jgi:asparagine synthase (glutamine-hydrolysing)
VPLGAFLSGGIDSSIIVGLMSREWGGDVRSFSLGFQDRSYDELAHARTVATHFGTRHREERVTPDIVDLADRLAAFYDEPFGDVSAFPTYLISSLARQEVTVALSGDGGDELFAGYDHYRAHRWAQRLAPLATRRGWRLVDRLLDGMPPRPAKKGALNKAKRFAEGLRRPEDLEHARWMVFQDVTERRALYSADSWRGMANRDSFAFYRGLLAEGAAQGFSGLQRQLYADIRGYLADDILTKVDRASMAVSLEVRVPFLDHEVVEYAMTIPPEWKLRGRTSKWILKQAYADMLPPSTLKRGKEGFSMPMKNWLRGPLQPLMRELLSPARLEANRLVRRHRGPAPHGRARGRPAQPRPPALVPHGAGTVAGGIASGGRPRQAIVGRRDPSYRPQARALPDHVQAHAGPNTLTAQRMLAMVVLLDNEAESVPPLAATIAATIAATVAATVAGAVHGRCGDRQPILVKSP